MDTITLIIGGALMLFLAAYMLRLIYTIFINLVNGRKFHHALDQQFQSLRLSRMLEALGIDRTAYLYQSRVKDIKRHMSNCSACENIAQCDEKLSSSGLDVNAIDFCNNESELKEIKQQTAKH